jgi:hypothetical protein
MQVQVIEKPLKYGGRWYEIGKPVEMTDKHARLFIAIGRACIPKAPRPDIPASPSLPVTIVELHDKAAVESTPSNDHGAEDSQAEMTEPAERPRRQYRRRDIRPENRDPQAED